MPKKKSRRRDAPSRPPVVRSPLRTGGRALGVLQVPFRQFLEAEADADALAAAGMPDEVPDEDWLSPGDVEARLMESLGWLLLAQGEDVVPSSATYFTPAELQSLLDEVLPEIAEANDLDLVELREEVAFAWVSYLEFLGESDGWRGEDEELADCLDVVAADAFGDAGAPLLDALAEAVADLTLEEELAALEAVPVLAASPPAEEATAEDRRAAGRAVLVRWIVDQVTGPDGEAPGMVGGLAALAGAVLGRPLTTEGLRAVVQSPPQESLDAALDLVGRLTAGGVLSATEPWAAPAGLGPAIAAAVRGFFDADQDEADHGDQDDDAEGEGGPQP